MAKDNPKVPARRPDSGPLDVRCLQVDPDDFARPVSLGKQEIDPADAAADVENSATLETEASDHAGDLIGSAGRKESRTPDEFQSLDHRVAVFRSIGLVHASHSHIASLNPRSFPVTTRNRQCIAAFGPDADARRSSSQKTRFGGARAVAIK